MLDHSYIAAPHLLSPGLLLAHPLAISYPHPIPYRYPHPYGGVGSRPHPRAHPSPPAPPWRQHPSSAPGWGEIIFQDDFSSAEAWALSATAKGSVALGKNKLTIAIAAPKSYISSIRSQPVVSDFYAEITASPNLCRGADE